MVKIFWFRKDLRLFDNTALSHFISDVKPDEMFIFLYIMNPNSFNFFGEMRISFLYESLKDISISLESKGLNLNIFKENSLNAFKELQSKYKKLIVYANKQIEPYCIKRDKEISDFLRKQNCSLNLYSDTTLFEPDEITKDDGNPYSVFTPFSRKCYTLINESHYKAADCNIDGISSENCISSKYIKFEELKKSPLLRGGRTEGVKLLKVFYKNGLDKYKSI